MPYAITECYLPPSRGNIHALPEAKPAAAQFSNPKGMQGWVDLTGCLHTEGVYPPKDGSLIYSTGLNTQNNFTDATNDATGLTDVQNHQPARAGYRLTRDHTVVCATHMSNSHRMSHTCLYFPATQHYYTFTSTHFPSHSGQEDELDWVAGDIARWLAYLTRKPS